ncbi:two component transcriptional regulator, LuxR family [Aureimonas altamirensis DSM 21988]|jgi:DNA-binding NarL/FixJ family response regulator|uniref:Two component transcriptional regulator, LuxR family n=1 Tax=Aureimonas altamirensis DSM 21988 TaxID=1121026 RepID=A0ABY1IQJ2_9HYPH|nr:response regulator transcription factor [Aureimonas altamirensis]SHJ91832.1 two component transcriptional regulator, LuxR family [Aureimonas altamirensis DSM 21988]
MLDKVHSTGRTMPQAGILANQHNYRSVHSAVAANARNDDTDHDAERTHVVIIDSRQLERECLASSLCAQSADLQIATFSNVEGWRQARARHPETAVILLHLGNRKITDFGIAADVSRVVAEAAPVPVIVIADTEEMPQIVKALECGAKGFIPTTVTIGVAIEAIELTLAGGAFVPASSILAMQSMLESGHAPERPLNGMFTARQMAVVDALRRGKANKIIAYELNLRESTVKVHVRNIMKKLKATNRTEVAFKIRDLLPETAGPSI